MVPEKRWQTVAQITTSRASDIAFVNQLERGADISGDDSLIIPVPPAPLQQIAQLTLYRWNTTIRWSPSPIALTSPCEQFAAGIT